MLNHGKIAEVKNNVFRWQPNSEKDSFFRTALSGEEKKKLTVEDLLALFAKASGDQFSNDRAILS